MKKLKNTLLTFAFALGLTGTLQAQDWANLKQFQDNNKEVGMPADNEHRVVFMGNSITIGWLNLQRTHSPVIF